jgi:hypothetical protein
MKKILGLILVAVLLGSCGVSKSVVKVGNVARPQWNGDVTQLNDKSDLPDGAIALATIYAGEHTSYNKVVREILYQARRIGANYVVFTSHQVRSGIYGEGYHNINSTAYWVDPSLLNKQKEVKKEEKNTDE